MTLCIIVKFGVRPKGKDLKGMKQKSIEFQRNWGKEFGSRANPACRPISEIWTRPCLNLHPLRRQPKIVRLLPSYMMMLALFQSRHVTAMFRGALSVFYRAQTRRPKRCGFIYMHIGMNLYDSVELKRCVDIKALTGIFTQTCLGGLVKTLRPSWPKGTRSIKWDKAIDTLEHTVCL